MNSSHQKTIRNLLSGCVAVATVILAGCGEDLIQFPAGDLPPTGNIGKSFGILRNTEEAGKTDILILREDVPATGSFYFELTRPVETDINRTVIVDESLVQAYNEANGTKFEAFPADGTVLSGDGQLTVTKGETRSAPSMFSLTFRPELPDTTLLALRVNEAAEGYNSLYFLVIKETKETPSKIIPKPGFPGQETKLMLCINTLNMTPRVAIYFQLEKNRRLYGMYEYVNILAATVKNDNGRPSLFFGNDIRHVLTNAKKYIEPLQLYGRKVCLTVQGGGEGIGFCNLDDNGIADLVYSLKYTVDKYGLDGINLWDENSKYDKEGARPVDPESYPKLIKALREAMPGKLIVLTDVGDPTASFDTPQGGIEVGRYIDYAFHAYNSECVINPWAAGSLRKPIAGLDPSKYGACYYNIPQSDTQWVNEQTEKVTAMRKAGGPTGLAVVMYDSSTRIDHDNDGFKYNSPIIIQGYFQGQNLGPDIDTGFNINERVPGWNFMTPGNISKDW